MRRRLDTLMVGNGLAESRSQAENLIRLGMVTVDGELATKAGLFVSDDSKLRVNGDKYVSRAALKLASVAAYFKLDFHDKVVLDVGSSTGGFTDYALQHGAKRVIAVDVGTGQLHPRLRTDERVEIHEQTDIRGFKASQQIDIVLADVSFISLREVLPYLSKILTHRSTVVAMVKPQFEATNSNLKHKGVIKNDAKRRKILKDFESWAKNYFVLVDKADSEVAGSKGNVERFYLLKVL